MGRKKTDAEEVSLERIVRKAPLEKLLKALRNGLASYRLDFEEREDMEHQRGKGVESLGYSRAGTVAADIFDIIGAEYGAEYDSDSYKYSQELGFYATYYTVTHHKSRKEYVCSNCADIIPKGTKYAKRVFSCYSEDIPKYGIEQFCSNGVCDRFR